MNPFDKLSIDARIVYLLSLSELIIGNISSSEGYEAAVQSLEKCWAWVKFKNIEAHDLYLYLENMDDTGVIAYMQLEDDAIREKVWICIGDALAYTIWEAYQYENEKYLPQTIESVDDETVAEFITNFNEVHENKSIADKLLEYLKINYPKDTDKKVDIDSIQFFIKGI